MMKKALVLAVALTTCFAIAGCCSAFRRYLERSKEDKSTTAPTATATTTTADTSTPTSGTAPDSTSLTGEQVIAKLKAKGWKQLTAPQVITSGPAKTTSFITVNPTITVLVMEYQDVMVAKMAFDAGFAKSVSPTMKAALFGKTVVTVSCAHDASQCDKAMNEITS